MTAKSLSVVRELCSVTINNLCDFNSTIFFSDVEVQFERTGYTLSSQSNNSVEICVKSTSKGTSEEFLIITETDSQISEV